LKLNLEEFFMEKKLIAAVVFTMFAGPALANMSFEDIDTDKNGSISKAEYDAGMKMKHDKMHGDKMHGDKMHGDKNMTGGSSSMGSDSGGPAVTDGAMSPGSVGGADSSSTTGGSDIPGAGSPATP
jgi:hypothetical protein